MIERAFAVALDGSVTAVPVDTDAWTGTTRVGEVAVGGAPVLLRLVPVADADADGLADAIDPSPGVANVWHWESPSGTAAAPTGSSLRIAGVVSAAVALPCASGGPSAHSGASVYGVTNVCAAQPDVVHVTTGVGGIRILR